MHLLNPKLAKHEFLADMVRDKYFPKPQVDKVKAVLLDLCAQIEAQRPPDAEALLKLTHAAVQRINALQEDFEEHGSELETGAREAIGADFRVIVDAYGFKDLDIEDVIAPREW